MRGVPPVPDDDHREGDFLREVREFCRTHVAPHCAEWERDERLPREIFTEAAAAGLMGMRAPRELGGRELSFTAYALAIKELGTHFAALAMDVAAHNSLCVGHLVEFGSEEQKHRCVPRLVSGKWLAAWALTEPHAGSDAAAIRTKAEPAKTDISGDGQSWQVTGHKTLITQGRRADLLIVLARTGTRENGKPEISAFLVRGEHARAVRRIPTYGMRASDTAEILFENAPAELIGRRGDGLRHALARLDRGRIGIAALAVGIATAALEAARDYAGQRRQFGRLIGGFQAIRWMLADSATELEAAELLVLRAAAMQDAHRQTTRESAMAKLFASETATRICNRALQIHGGYGYTRDCPVERYLRDAKLCEIAEGTSEVQRLVIARAVLGDEPPRPAT